MAGTSNDKLILPLHQSSTSAATTSTPISTAEAKARLVELGRQHDETFSVRALSNRAVRTGILVAIGALLGVSVGGRRRRHKHKDGLAAGGIEDDEENLASSIRRTIMRTGLTTAPLLIEHFVRELTEYKESTRQAETNNESRREETGSLSR